MKVPGATAKPYQRTICMALLLILAILPACLLPGLIDTAAGQTSGAFDHEVYAPPAQFRAGVGSVLNCKHAERQIKDAGLAGLLFLLSVSAVFLLNRKFLNATRILQLFWGCLHSILHVILPSGDHAPPARFAGRGRFLRRSLQPL